MAGEFPVISSECIYLIDNKKYLWGLSPFKDGYLISRSNNGPTGKESVQSAHNMFDWLFENTDAYSIYGQIHKDNKPSCYSACHAGMKRDYEKDNYIFYKVTRNAKNKAA